MTIVKCLPVPRSLFATCLLLLLPFSADADVGKKLHPLPCGIYDQAVKPFIEKDLETQSPDKALYTIEMTTNHDRNLSVEIKSVEIAMPGERNQVTIHLDGKLHVRTSHQDVPLYVEVHLDGDKYRIICVRVEPGEVGSEEGEESLDTVGPEPLSTNEAAE